MKRVLVLVLALSIVSAGCASGSGGRVPLPAPPVSDTPAMSEFVQKLPVGSRVRVERTDGHTVKGTLMGATPRAITVESHTRVPEPPLEIPLNTVTRVTLEGSGTSTAKAVGIGIAAGVGAFFGIAAILAAVFND